MNQTTKKVLSSLVRPAYSPGLLLNYDDLNAGVDYTRDLSRLLMRSLLGCGIVCGYTVTVDTSCNLTVNISKGLALDCHGDPVYMGAATPVVVDVACTGVKDKPLWVLVRRFQKACAPRAAVCGPDDDAEHSAPTRIYEGVEIAIVETEPTNACQKTETKTGATVPSGECECECVDGSDGEWIVLARLDPPATQQAKWDVITTMRRELRREPAVATTTQTQAANGNGDSPNAPARKKTGAKDVS